MVGKLGWRRGTILGDGFKIDNGAGQRACAKDVIRKLLAMGYLLEKENASRE